MINIQKVCMVLTMHFMWFLWILQQRATFAIYYINRFGFVTEVERFTAQLLWTHTHTQTHTHTHTHTHRVADSGFEFQ